MQANENCSCFKKVSKQGIKIQEPDDVFQQIFPVQDNIVRIVCDISRANWESDWEAEIYWRVSDLKRVLSEIDINRHEIQMVVKA